MFIAVNEINIKHKNYVIIAIIVTLFLGAFGMICKLCYKSKCSNIICCFGLINIKRNVEIENDIETTDIIPNKV